MDTPYLHVSGCDRVFCFRQCYFSGAYKAVHVHFNSVSDALFDFAQLLLTFCKISVRELMPSPWHGWLLLIQAISSLVLAALLLWLPMREEYRDVFEGAMVCLICPTATAAAVITGKLGGSASSLTTYTLLSNLLAAIVVPLVFPLVEPHAEITFFAAFLKILGKVFPLLLFPFSSLCSCVDSCRLSIASLRGFGIWPFISGPSL